MVKYRIRGFKGSYIIERKQGFLSTWKEVIWITRPLDLGMFKERAKDFKDLADLAIKALAEIKKADKRVGIK